MRPASAVLAVLALVVAAPAAGEDAPELDDERYVLERVDDGVMRIDRETGATSHCRQDDDGWACRAVPDEREALEDEIARLAEENAALADRTEELEQRLAAIEGEAPGDAEETPDMPSEAEIDRFMETFETMMRRFLGMVRSLREDYGDRL